MSDHVCPHEQAIGVIKNTLKKIDIAVNGNGKDGLVIEVDRLKNSHKAMNADLGKIATAMSGLAQARDAEIAIERDREKNKASRSSAIQRVGTVAAIIFGAVGALAVILNHIAQ